MHYLKKLPLLLWRLLWILTGSFHGWKIIELREQHQTVHHGLEKTTNHHEFPPFHAVILWICIAAKQPYSPFIMATGKYMVWTFQLQGCWAAATTHADIPKQITLQGELAAQSSPQGDTHWRPIYVVLYFLPILMPWTWYVRPILDKNSQTTVISVFVLE